MKYDLKDKYYLVYLEFIKDLEIKYNQSVAPYKDLKLNNYKEYGKWKYHRHHIDEYFISGAELILDKKRYKEGLAVKCDVKEHSFLHYLIVKGQQTYLNTGILNAISLTEWIKNAKEYSKKYNLEYDDNWIKLLNFGEDELEMDY